MKHKEVVKMDFARKVDGNEVGTYDALITIFYGVNDEARIKRFFLTADGTDDDKYITLEDCRKMIGETSAPVTVIFDDWTHGEIYTYGNYGNEWWQVGITQGFA